MALGRHGLRLFTARSGWRLGAGLAAVAICGDHD